MKLYNHSEVAARIRELSEQTGIPLSEWQQCLDSEPPAGISPEMWASSLLAALKAPPLPPEVKRQIARMAAPTLKAPAA